MRPAVAGGWRTVVAQGAGRRTRLRPLREHERQPSRARIVDRRHRSRRSTARRRCRVGTLEPRRRHLRRRDAAALRQRRPGRAARGRPARSRPRPAPLHIGGNGSGASGSTARSTRSASTTALSAPAEIQNDMVRSVTPDTIAPTILARTPAAGRRRHQRRQLGHRRVQRADGRRHASPPRRFQLKDARNAVVPATVTYDAATSTATLTPQNALSTARPTRSRVKGGAGRRHGPRRQPARSRLDLDRSRSRRRRRRSSSSARRATRSARTSARSSERGPERVHDDRRGLRLTRAARAVRRRRARRHAAHARPGDDADGLGQRRREPDRDAARQAARRPARTDRCGHDARERLPPGRHRHRRRAPASSAARCSSTAPPTATRSTAPPSIATLYSNATTATTNPAVTLRSVGASGGQAAAFTYDLARSVVYTRQGNPAWAGQERDGVVGHPPRRPVLRRARRRRAARLDRHEQDRDPAGRRAAAAAR